MNNVQTQVAIDVMQGFLMNKRIQVRAIQEMDADQWVDTINPSWNWESFLFRVAPWYIDMINGNLNKVLCHVNITNQDIVRVIISAEEIINANGDTVLLFTDVSNNTWDYAVPVDDSYSQSVII